VLAGAVRAVRPVTGAVWRGVLALRARPKPDLGRGVVSGRLVQVGRGRVPQRLAGPAGRPKPQAMHLKGQYWVGQG
jgi:hypothetical protein